MIRLQHSEPYPDASVYVVIYNDAGDRVLDNEHQGFILYNSDEDPSNTTDPNYYGIDMTEDAERLGWHFLDVDWAFENGLYRYEVFKRSTGSASNSRMSDSLRAISYFEVIGEAVVTMNDSMSSTTSVVKSVNDLERAVLRAANRANAGKSRPR